MSLRKQIRVMAYTAAIIVALATSSSAPSQQPDQSKLMPAPDATEIAALIRQLGHDSFREREAASRRLLAIGATAVRPLRRAKGDPDPEISCRARAILEQIPEAHFIDEEGFLRAWLVLLPLPYGEKVRSGTAALDQQQVAREACLRPRLGDKVEVGGMTYVWKKCTPKNYRLDFNKFLRRRTSFHVCYAVAYVEAENERKNLKLRVYSDDECKIYLNSKLTYRYEKVRPHGPPPDVIAGITLKKGVNVVVFKVVNEGGDWCGFLQFIDRDNNPVTDLEAKLKP